MMLYTTHLRRILFSLIILGFGLVLFAQTGPGGVGSSASNILWLKANEITGLSDGADVLTWSDGSGNGNTLTQPTASLSPTYQTSEINGLPVVRFSKTNGRIRRTSFTDFPTTAITAIYVNKTTDSGDGAISYASSSSNNDFLLFRSENLNVYRGTNIGSSVTFNDNAFHIANAVWRNSDGRVEVWKDGSQDFTSTGFRTGTSITAGGSLAIAGEQDSQDGGYASNQAHFGDFSEVMIFDTFLNTAQNIIVTNYLAAKYALTISNDRYAYQSTHANDVAGIGREDVSNTHTAAMSADILRVEGATGLDANQEYLLFGHNGGDATAAWTTTEAPDGGADIQRLAREWRFDETGTVGNINIVIDVAGMPALPAGHTVYALMVDSDGDFSSGATVYELSLDAGTEYSYSGYDINDGDYMAIAAVRPVVQHTNTASAGAESVLAPTIEVSLNFTPATSRTIDVTTADVTTTVVDDYTALSGSTVTITAGNTTATYSITIIDDSDAENNESLTATLGNPSAGLTIGTNSVHTYTIEDNDQVRKVYFDAATSSGSETVTSVNVGLSINVQDALNPTSVDYAVTGGTASGSGTDFTLLGTGTVTFAAGVTSESFSITINNESLFELDEDIIITLSNPVNCNLDNTMPFAGTGAVTHTYTITNDDTAPTMQFNTASGSGSESVTAVAFQVDLSGVSGADASASFTVTGSATPGGTDFTLADGVVTIPAGSTTVNIDAIIVDDSVEELSETIIVTLSAPTNTSIVGNDVFTYTILNNSVIGFTGPGGVGQASSNILWVRPEELSVVADGTNIDSWSDFSGNGNDLSQSDNSFKPRYYNSIVNSRPVARFDQSNGRLIKNSFVDFPTNQITAVFVNATNETSDDGLLSYASSASDNEFLLFSTNSLSVYRGGSNTNSTVGFNGGGFNVGTTTWQSSNGGTAVWKNGSRDYNITGFQTGTSMTTSGNLAIGAEQDGINTGYNATQDHLGDFAEVAIYNIALNQTQVIIVQNYLSAKYNIALSTNDVYNEDDNGNYDFEVAGIGRIGASDLHVDAKGSGIVRVNNVGDLDNEEFFMWGHDNADLEATSTDAPIGISRRLERIWRVSEVNRSGTSIDVGSVDISFDLTGLGSVTPTDLVLLVDADGTFATGATQITGAISDGGNVYRFANVTAFTDNMRFTLSTLDKDQTPLPVDLIAFSGRVTAEDQVQLNWSTASEAGNSHFDVERSSDGRIFESLGTVGGNGNSETILDYTFYDPNPLHGRSFYRLKQIDFNGEYEYSEIISVLVANKREGYFSLYPNPVIRGHELKVSYDLSQAQTVYISVIGPDGDRKYQQEIKTNGTRGTISLRTDRMVKGVNLIQIITTDKQRKVLKVIIQ